MVWPGWDSQQFRGGIVAGVLFVLPSIFILWALSFIYVAYGNVPWIAAIFYGLKPAVLAIVAVAVIRIGSKALKNAIMWSLALVAFVAIYFFHAPFPLIIISAGILGLIGSKILPQYFRGEIAHPVDVDLKGLLQTSHLITDFPPLPSEPLLNQEVQNQEQQKENGTYSDTNLVIYGGGTLVSLTDPTATTASPLQGFAPSQNVTIVANVTGPPAAWSAMATHLLSGKSCSNASGVIVCS